MQQPPPTPTRIHTSPSFYLTSPQPLRPGVILLAFAAALAALCSFAYAINHARHARLLPDGSGNASSARGSAAGDDKDDDPNQIDTIVLGDPADAPVPAHHGNHVSPVHPTILIVLPREGAQTGLIPDSPAGHLLYNWLAAFNHASSSELADALPSAAPTLATAAQLALRRQTGGFNLLSAKEVQTGILVFRLRDQTPAAGEVLGTLQVRPDSSPAAIASFSLRAVDPPHQDSKAASR